MLSGRKRPPVITPIAKASFTPGAAVPISVTPMMELAEASAHSVKVAP